MTGFKESNVKLSKLILLTLLIFLGGFGLLKGVEILNKWLNPIVGHRQNLEVIANRLFSPLNYSQVDEEKELRNIWMQAKKEYAGNRISQEDAQILVKILAELNRINHKRLEFTNRQQAILRASTTQFRSGFSSNEKQTMAENALKREWNEWIKGERPKVSPHLYRFSK